jgi:hypothetical protein
MAKVVGVEVGPSDSEANDQLAGVGHRGCSVPDVPRQVDGPGSFR